MAPQKWIDKNTATTYKLVHRPQNDPLIHDVSSSSMVFKELDAPQASKKDASTRGNKVSDSGSDLQSQTGGSSEFSIRDNEGEAAEHGVYYDDTEYDYMQHLRDLGSGNGEAYFVEAKPVAIKGKGRAKGKGKENSNGVSLDEALRTLSLKNEKQERDKAGKITDDSILPSRNLRVVTYQDQQDMPDALRGFQPDMDWRLREALEALNDSEYVDNEDQDLFDQLVDDAEEIDNLVFEDTGYALEEEDDGWESDRTARPKGVDDRSEEIDHNDFEEISEVQAKESNVDVINVEVGDLPPSDVAPPDAPSDPFAAFRAHKAQTKEMTKGAPSSASVVRDPRIHDGAAASTVLTNASFMSGRRKKRKGALTNPSSYSMTSSALYRTEGQTLLDARFNKVLETQYEEEDGEADLDDDIASIATGVTGQESVVSGMSSISGISTASSRHTRDLVRQDYSGVMGMMNDFLDGYGGGAVGARGKKGKSKAKARRDPGGQTGMEQLDEIRKELGRPQVAGVR